MQKRFLLLLLCCAALGGVIPSQAAVVNSPADPALALSTASLENTRWRLIELGRKPAVVHRTVAEASITLVTEGNRVRGSTGCAQLTGRYQREVKALRFFDLSTPRRACLGAMAKQQSRFKQALTATRRWQIQGETLDLLNGEGARLARFESLYLR